MGGNSKLHCHIRHYHKMANQYTDDDLKSQPWSHTHVGSD